MTVKASFTKLQKKQKHSCKIMETTVKYRVWDKETKEMIYSGIEYTLRALQIEYPAGENGSFIGFTQTEMDRFDFMKFTGYVKDGVEYYDGDIVLVRGMKKVGEYIDVIVKGKQDGFTFKYNKTMYNDDSCFISIIARLGNIYENPEFLHKEI